MSDKRISRRHSLWLPITLSLAIAITYCGSSVFGGATAYDPFEGDLIDQTATSTTRAAELVLSPYPLDLVVPTT